MRCAHCREVLHALDTDRYAVAWCRREVHRECFEAHARHRQDRPADAQAGPRTPDLGLG